MSPTKPTVTTSVSGECRPRYGENQTSHPAQYAGRISGSIEKAFIHNNYRLLAEGALDELQTLADSTAHMLKVRVVHHVRILGDWEADVFRCEDLKDGDLGLGVPIPETGYAVWSRHLADGFIPGRYRDSHKQVFATLEDAIGAWKQPGAEQK